MRHIREDFEKCVIESDDGKSVKCKLSLWEVNAQDRETADKEATHYWFQYFCDGEYDILLNKKEVV